MLLDFFVIHCSCAWHMQFIIMLGHTYCLEKKIRDHQAGRGKYLKERVIEIHTLIVGCIWLEIWPEYLLNIHTTLLDWNMLTGGEQC